MNFNEAASHMPLIAILRGVKPEESVEIAAALLASGITIVEVPLNSPDPFRSIERIVKEFADEILVGAGTVLSSDQVTMVSNAGGKLVVSPNTNVAVITRTKALKLTSGPGAATPSEAFLAVEAGADFVKVFPAEQITPTVLKSWRSVLPSSLPLFPVGGISANSMQAYWESGASGFGIGGSLYKPGATPAKTREQALQMVSLMQCLIGAHDESLARGQLSGLE